MGMVKFVLCIVAIAVSQLGFESDVFNVPDKYECFASEECELAERVLEDILQPEFDDEDGKGLLMYVLGRFRRWWHNRWKHRIVYSDGLVGTFFVQVWGHMRKMGWTVGK